MEFIARLPLGPVPTIDSIEALPSTKGLAERIKVVKIVISTGSA